MMRTEDEIRYQLSLLQERVDHYTNLKENPTEPYGVIHPDDIREFAEIRRCCYQNAVNALLWVLKEGGI